MTPAVAAAAASAEAAASSDRRVRTSQLPFAAPGLLAGADPVPPRPPAGGRDGAGLGPGPGLAEPGRPVRAGSKAVTGAAAAEPAAAAPLRGAVKVPRPADPASCAERSACSCGPSLVRRKKSAATSRATASTMMARKISACIRNSHQVNGREPLRQQNPTRAPLALFGCTERTACQETL